MQKNLETKRPPYDEYFMEMARLVAKRSTCLRRKVGAVVVKNKHILVTTALRKALNIVLKLVVLEKNKIFHPVKDMNFVEDCTQNRMRLFKRLFLAFQ